MALYRNVKGKPFVLVFTSPEGKETVLALSAEAMNALIALATYADGSTGVHVLAIP